MRAPSWVLFFTTCLALAPVQAEEAPSLEASTPVGDVPPEDVAGEVGIEPRPNAQLPLETTFMTDAGELVTLGDMFQGERPVLLNLVYFRCPSLCNLALNEMLVTLKGMSWTPGQEFEVVTISINPMETANLARAKKRGYVEEYGRPEAAAGWHWLTGTETAIRQVTDAVGFSYKFDTATQEYAHSAGLFICSPEGKLSRTLFGVMHEPTTLKFSLLEASEGKVGSAIDQLILYCYHYDPDTGQYTAAVMNIMRLAAGLTVLLLGGLIGLLLWREKRQRARSEPAPVHPARPAAAGGTL